MPQNKKDKGTGAMVGGGALTAYGAANAPVLRAGSKDRSKMVGASPKLQGKRYQAKLHQAMKAGKVEADSTVHVLRTPSGRHINAGGTHRHIARQEMGKPSRYEVKDIKHEVHVSPAQKLQAGMRLRGLRQGSKAAEAGKKVRSVSPGRAGMNQGLAAAADVNDAALWKNPSALKSMVGPARKAGLVGAGTFAAGGLALAGSGAKKRREYKQHNVAKSSVSAFGIDHGMVH